MSQTNNYSVYSNLVNEREDKIESVAQVANRMKTVAINIGNELDVHTDLLDEIGEKTPLIHDHVKKTQLRLKNVLVRSEDKARWTLICFLCFLLIVVIFLALIF